MARFPLPDDDGENMALHRSEQNLGLRVPHLRLVDASGPVPASILYLTSRRKRALDLLIGSIGIAIVAVMFVPVAIVIKLTSPGPVFYRQRRLGLNGREFMVVKFRTMTQNAEAKQGAVWAKRNDPRTTRVGRVLRRLYIDEFPQWWNVVKGDMSVVGPRPERPELAAQIVDFVPNFHERLKAKPGITGVAQVNYKYTNTMLEARNKLRHDIVYIKAASFSVDLRLILRTFRRVWMFKGT